MPGHRVVRRHPGADESGVDKLLSRQEEIIMPTTPTDTVPVARQILPTRGPDGVGDGC
jgi:hypothetical protein